MSKWLVKKGNTSVQDIPIYKKDGVTLVDNLVDATNIDFQIKETKTGIAKIAKTKDSGITINTPLTGWLRITLIPTDTDLIAKHYIMAIQIIWSDTEKYEIKIYIDNQETDDFVIEQDIIQ